MRNRFVKVSTFTDPMDANLCKCKLELNGIETRLDGEIISRIQWTYSNAIGGIKVLVKENQFEKAKELIESESYIKKELICPKCNSIRITYGSILKRIFRFAFAMFFLGPTYKLKNKCKDCGYNWAIDLING